MIKMRFPTTALIPFENEVGKTALVVYSIFFHSFSLIFHPFTTLIAWQFDCINSNCQTAALNQIVGPKMGENDIKINGVHDNNINC